MSTQQEFRWITFLAGSLILAMTGCNPARVDRTAEQNDGQSSSVAQDTTGLSATESDPDTPMDGGLDHGHLSGTHGGIIVSLGRDSYHVEAVVDSEGSISLYTLGQDESRVIDVEVQTLKGFVKADGDVDSKPISFTPSPQEGDADGKTSLFVGQLPEELVGRKLDVTVPNIRIDGERFRLGFVTGQESHGDSPEMPEKIGNDAERDLYLTPGGRYTAADILANGSMTASQKFKGIKSEHDMRPKVGDKLCPISGTKANMKFAWVIEGKSYVFCCPPCIDEFLTTAKTSDEPLPEPDSFTKE